MSKNPWKTLSRNLIYKNPWIEVQEHEVLNPSGNSGIYGVVNFQNLAVGIVPIDEEGFTYLVGQYRYPLNHYSWEIIEGGSPLGQSLLEGAKRELKEETGLEAQEWHFLADLHTSNSVTNEHATLFVALGLTQGKPQPDETEMLRIQRIKLEEVFVMAHQGEITDAMSLVALHRLESCWDSNQQQMTTLPQRLPIWQEKYPL